MTSFDLIRTISLLTLKTDLKVEGLLGLHYFMLHLFELSLAILDVMDLFASLREIVVAHLREVLFSINLLNVKNELYLDGCGLAQVQSI